MELLDEVQVDACNRFSKLSLPVTPTLFFEFHGTKRGTEEQIESVGAIASEHGAADFRWAARPEERSTLWQARHDAYYAALALRPGRRGWATDVCVPISALATCLLETKADIERAGLLAPIVGHVGDGNFHVAFIIDPDDPAEFGPAKAVNDRMIRRALALGGTCTGEHGVGFAKLGYLEAEHGEALGLMRAIKRALDPKGIMNPGKVVPGL
jgi:D-lactate dehydrogenase (cytochrome)